MAKATVRVGMIGLGTAGVNIYIDSASPQESAL